MKRQALLIGECHNVNRVPIKSWDVIPAFYPGSNSSGEWIHKQLASPILVGWKFILENSVTLDRSARRLHEFHAVVALSKRVATYLDLPYLPHPAFWKRFHHGSSDAWVKILHFTLQKCLKKS